MRFLRFPALLFLALILGCDHGQDATKSITLATTTSTSDSGLLDMLRPMFRQQTGIEVRAVAVGSGQALEMGRRGDADVLLTHAPQAEDEFMAEGYGSKRHAVMHNDFVLVGPSTDRAGVSAETLVIDALRRIAEAEADFVSRNDDSGTHRKEMRLWGDAGLSPEGTWYLKTGSGMAHALRVASEKRAYTLSDRGTFLSQRSSLELTILFENDPPLQNDYSVILINPAKHPHVHHEAATRFAEFLLEPATQEAIGRFGVEQWGQPLFFPEG